CRFGVGQSCPLAARRRRNGARRGEQDGCEDSDRPRHGHDSTSATEKSAGDQVERAAATAASAKRPAGGRPIGKWAVAQWSAPDAISFETNSGRASPAKDRRGGIADAENAAATLSGFFGIPIHVAAERRDSSNLSTIKSTAEKAVVAPPTAGLP